MAELSTAQEVEIVSRLVRGDTYSLIVDEMGVSTATISKVKRRQANAIATISGQLLKRKQKTAERILDKTHQLLENRIDSALRYEEKLATIETAWHDELVEDTYDDEKLEAERIKSVNAIYGAKLRHLRDELFSNSALISLSKEMSDESKGDDVDPSAAPPASSQAQLEALVEALKAGDEVKLQQIILNPKDDD